jgi:hypothetical protein
MRLQLHILASLLLLTFCSNAQTFLWGRTIKSEGFDESYDLAVDPQGNVYVAGMIEYIADFGNGVLLESSGVHDIFIAKYDSVGTLVWAVKAGGSDGDKIQSITLDGKGSIYVTGEFEDTSYWGPIMKIAEGGNNNFVARYDTSGNVLWVRSLGTVSPSHTRGYGVCTDANGNVYAVGGTLGDTYLDGNFLFTSYGDYDGIIISYDPSGNFRWAKHVGGTDSDKARGIVSDQAGYIYVTGYYSNTAHFSGSNISTQGHTDIFLAKYDTLGFLQWVKSAGDTGYDRAWDVDINVNGQIIIAGDQSRGRFDNNYASCQGMTDAFLAAYDDAGNNLWVTSGGGPEDDEGRAVSHDNAGNLYLMGDYGGSAIFPPISFTGGHYAEPFIASYNQNGTSLRWARNGMGPSNDRGTGIGLDSAGNIYACGNFDQTMQLGSLNLVGDSLYDIFVTRLSSQNVCFTSASVSGTINCAGLCNGTATATAVGQAPYTYSWNTLPVQTAQTATGLCAGNYTVTVTDNTGCTSSGSIVLTDPPPFTVSSTFTDVTCYNSCNGTATANAPGQGPFTYTWNTVPVQTSQIATGLCAGNYTVTVTNPDGCTSTSNVSLVNPQQISLITSSTDITCFGACNGTADATASGQGPFTYSWNTTPVQATETATNLCAGNYTVTVTDANGCTSTSSLALVDPAQLIITPAVTSVLCNGQCTGAVDAGVTGNGPFTFTWNTTPVQTTQVASSLCAGSYTVTVTDNDGCTSTSSVLVTQPLALTLSANITNATCTGCSDGVVDATPGGGVGNYQYTWSNGATTQDISGVSSGTYTLCIEDANLCALCDYYIVYDPSTGIKEPGLSMFSIYPNPVSNIAIIHLPDNSQNAELNLFNSIGEKIFTSEINGIEYKLETSSLAGGIYLVEISTHGSIATKPLIVQH